MSFNNVQKAVFLLGKRLGYMTDRTAGMGVCNGFTMKWLEASLLHEEELFNQRILQIINNSPEIQDVIKVKEKVRKKIVLSNNEQSLLDMLAFYENMMLYQKPQNYQDIFNQPANQNDISYISQFASADQIKERGGLVSVFVNSWIYSTEDAILWMNHLSELINTVYAADINHIIGFRLSSENHAIGLTYDIKNQSWTFMNVNHFPSEKFKLNEISHIAAALRASFLIPKDEKQFVFSVTVLTTGNDPQATLLANALEKINHIVTDNIIKSGQMNNLACIAAQMNDLNTLSDLMAHGVDLKQNTRLALLAAYMGHVSVLRALKKFGMNLNAVYKNDLTPMYYAAQKGYVDVVQFLLDSDSYHSIPFKPTPDYIKQLHDILDNSGKKRLIDWLSLRKTLHPTEAVSIRPEEIASIMGHQHIESLFKMTAIKQFKQIFTETLSGEKRPRDEESYETEKESKKRNR